MISRPTLALLFAPVLTACATQEPAAAAPAPSAMDQAEARLGTVPPVPDGAPLTGEALVERVSGGPYALTIFSAGVAATSNWDLEGGRAYGTFRVVETGEGGEWSVPAFVADGKLCTEQSGGTVCQTIYPWRDGFMEVTEAGEVHAVTVPAE